MSLRPQQRPLQRPIALAMAALYALLAMAGQGLHELTHGWDGVCEHVAHASDSPSCCCEHEPPTARPNPAQDDHRWMAVLRAADGEGHDPHTCSVCSLLAQLKVGHGPAPLATTASATPADFVLTLPPTYRSAKQVTLGPRGPPAIG